VDFIGANPKPVLFRRNAKAYVCNPAIEVIYTGAFLRHDADDRITFAGSGDPNYTSTSYKPSLEIENATLKHIHRFHTICGTDTFDIAKGVGIVRWVAIDTLGNITNHLELKRYE